MAEMAGMGLRVWRGWACTLSATVVLAGSACSRPEPPKQYQLQGQILGVHPEKNQITIKHGDIDGLMPGMTMSFPVKTPALMEGRTPGDLVTATLEVSDALGTLTAITKTGSSPLPANTNEAMLVAGILAEGDEVPDAALIDQDDRRRSLAEWRGTITLFTFTYTRCPLPDFCPLMDQNFATLQRALAEDPQLRGSVRLVSISVDPEHDTPAVLAAHAKKRRADAAVWTFLTGDRTTIERTAGRFGVGIVRAPDGTMDITHNLRTALVGRDGRVRKVYTGNDWTPGAVLADLRAAARAQ